jgi:hypothetical protein
MVKKIGLPLSLASLQLKIQNSKFKIEIPTIKIGGLNNLPIFSMFENQTHPSKIWQIFSKVASSKRIRL